MLDFASLLYEISIQLFLFPFLFPSVCCSVYIVSDVIGRCNSSFALFDVVFQSSLSLMQTICLPPSFLVTHNLSMSSLWCSALCIFISFLVFSSIYLSSAFFLYWECLRAFFKGNCPGVYTFYEISAAEFGNVRLSRLSEIHFCLFFFFYPCLFDGIHFQYSLVLVIFLIFIIFIFIFVFFNFVLLIHLFVTKIKGLNFYMISTSTRIDTTCLFVRVFFISFFFFN